jgi:hypothetical protein
MPMLGLVAGLMLSAGIFAVLWRLDKVVRLPSDLAIFGPDVPVMEVPLLRGRRSNWPPSFVRIATALHSGLRGSQDTFEPTIKASTPTLNN